MTDPDPRDPSRTDHEQDHHGLDHRTPAQDGLDQDGPDHDEPSTPHTRPDVGLTRWFVQTDVFATGEPTTETAYADYLAHCEGSPLPRRRFVHDLRLLGVLEAVDDQTSLLVRS